MLADAERARVGASTAALRAARIERRLGRFRREVQARVRGVAALHPWLADLAISFPGLLFALAVPHRREAAARALALVMNGSPMTLAANVAGAPMWLRAFPPQAFARPIRDLPDSIEFRRNIANHHPKRWRDAPRWIDSVSIAFETAGEDVSLWMARAAPRPRRRRGNRPAPDYRRLVSLWAWCCLHDAPARMFVSDRWTPQLSWRRAQESALRWADALTSHFFLGETGVTDGWLAPGCVDGYEFTPLRTARDLAEESAAMCNCVRSYGWDLADNFYRVWSVRKDGARVATLCLSLAAPKAPYPHIHELSGHKNSAVPPCVWFAARRWLHAQDRPVEDCKRFDLRRSTMDAHTWRTTWKPYWTAGRRIPSWLPLKPVSLYAL